MFVRNTLYFIVPKIGSSLALFVLPLKFEKRFARFSARGLAKLAAWMANKGQEPGKSSGGMKLMSEDTWNQMHAEEKLNADIEIGGFR